MVQMLTGRAELLEKGETTKDHTKHQKIAAEELEEDKANNHPTKGGLFGGLFKPKPPRLEPLYDFDDNVPRCPHCGWELEDGNCPSCGYQQPPNAGDSDGSESDDYSEDDLDSFDGLDEAGPTEGDLIDNIAEEDDYPRWTPDQDLIWAEFARNNPTMRALQQQAFRQHRMNHHVPGRPYFPQHHMVPQGNSDLGLLYRAAPAHTNGDAYDEEDEEEDDDEDEEDEYDEADSFIDDENNDVPTSSFIDNGLHDTSGEVYDEHSDSQPSTGTVVDDIHGGDTSSTDGLRQWRDTTPYIDIDEESAESSEDEDEAVRPPPRRPQTASRSHFFQPPSQASWLTARSRAQAIPDSDDEVEEISGESESEISPPARRPAGRAIASGNTAGNAITLDDSDEGPVGPVRRNTHRRHMRFSPY